MISLGFFVDNETYHMNSDVYVHRFMYACSCYKKKNQQLVRLMCLIIYIMTDYPFNFTYLLHMKHDSNNNLKSNTEI